MRKTEPDEIKVVMDRLSIFDSRIKQELVDNLANPVKRLEQHRLFYLLLDDRKFQPLKRAMKILKKYNHQPYVNRAITLVQKIGDTVQYDANVAEIIVVAYYIEKFRYEPDKVIWERKIGTKKRSVDITINGYKKPVNIEITGLTDPADIREFNKDHFAFRSKLRDLIEDRKNPRFCYFITFPDVGFIDLAHAGFLKTFMNQHLKEFADFIKEHRVKGVGEYTYRTKDGVRARVKVLALNKAKREYVENAFGWSGWVRNSFRIRSKVIEKARRQLPPNEINLVYIPNLAMLDDDDYTEAMYGQLQVVVNIEDHSKDRIQYADNGISRAIEDEKLSPVHGLIKSSFDYFDTSKRSVISNNRHDFNEDILKLIE